MALLADSPAVDRHLAALVADSPAAGPGPAGDSPAAVDSLGLAEGDTHLARFAKRFAKASLFPKVRKVAHYILSMLCTCIQNWLHITRNPNLRRRISPHLHHLAVEAAAETVVAEAAETAVAEAAESLQVMILAVIFIIVALH